MKEPVLDTFSMENLRRRHATFRWLWSNHDMVAGVLDIHRGKDPRVPVWSNFARMAAREGVTVTRDALRRMWPVVQDEWDKTPASLRAPLPDEHEIGLGGPASSLRSPATEPRHASAASGTEFFSAARMTSTPEPIGFLLPDLTGKKI